jgi:hypothetical protein
MQYTNKFGTIQVLSYTKIFHEKTIAVSMSGGVDSTMLCYLLANTIHEKKLKTVIQPYNGYDLWAPIDSAGVPDIINYIREKFPEVDIRWPISAIFNTDGNKIDDKNIYIRPLIKTLQQKKIVDLVMNGVSHGPALDVQKTFLDGGTTCRLFRLPGEELWNELERAVDYLSPFKHVDKRFIVQCYKDFGIEDLLKMTNSCTVPQGNCGECWWCQERAWAFKEVFG